MISLKNKILIIYFFLISYNIVYSQDSISENIKLQFLNNSQSKLSPSEIISNFRLTEDKWLNINGYTGIPAKFEYAYSLNVIDFFSLNDSLNSDLKKMVFTKSIQYQKLYDSLLKIKSGYLKSIFYSRNILNGNIGSHIQTFDKNLRSDDLFYDTKKLGYFIKIGFVLPYGCDISSCPKVLNDIEFKQLPIIKSYNLPHSKRSCTQYIFLPMPPERAIELENHLKDVEILTVFNIKDITISSFSDSDFLAENSGKPCKLKVVQGGSFRLLVYNKITQEIYFDNLYKEYIKK